VKKNVLITGGAGFIGSFLSDRLLKAGYHVRVLDNLDPQVHGGGKRPVYLNKDCEFIKGDIRDREVVCQALKNVDQVVHLAAKVGVGQSQYEIHNYTDVNIAGTANLLDHWVNRFRDKISKVLVASSMSIYGEGMYQCPQCGLTASSLRSEEQLKKGQWEPVCGTCSSNLQSIPTRESQPLLGSSIYAITKRVQEEMVISIGKTYNLPVVALRFFNVYGPRQSLSNPYTGVLSLFISRIKNKRSPIIYEDGEQTRDFISVHDVAEACQRCLENEQLKCEVMNLGSGQALSIKKIAEILTAEMKTQVSCEVTQQFRKGDIRHCYADTTLLKDRTGFKIGTSFKERLKEVIAWAQTEEAHDYSDKAVAELKNKGLV